MDMRLRYYLNLRQNVKLNCWHHFAFSPVIFYSNYISCLNFDANIVGISNDLIKMELVFDLSYNCY